MKHAFSALKSLTLCSVISLSACHAPAPPQLPMPQKPLTAAGTTKNWPVRFKVRFDQRFRTACSQCRAEYVKLELRGPGHVSTPLYAMGADENGFVQVVNDQVQLSVNVPEGHNWTAIAGLYSTNQAGAEPVLRAGAAFHVPVTDPQIEMDLRALQTAEIIKALHQLGSDKVLSPLQLEQFQAFTDALLGVEQQPDGTYVMNRLPAGQDPAYFLDAGQIARMFDLGQLAQVNAQSGEQLDPEVVSHLPENFLSYRAQSMTAGLTHLAMNPSSGHLFSFDILQNTKRIYGLRSALDPQPLTPLFNPVSVGRLQNLWLSLGWANPTAQSRIPVIYLMEYTGVNRMMLKALNQETGALVWSYDFDQLDSLETRFVPVRQRDDRGTVNPADDTDTVYTALLSDHWTYPGTRGIYALQDGQVRWRYSEDRELTGSGALSRDGQKLYVITRSDPFTSAKLLALKTNPSQPPLGEAAWVQEVDLGEEAFDTTTPAVGSDGTVYVNTITTAGQISQMQLSGHLQAIAANGQLKWKKPLPVTSFFPPVIDHDQGEDVIYTSTEGAKVHAFRQDGTPKWTFSLPGTVGEGPAGSPLIAADSAGQRIIYVPWGNGLIYAVRDQGASAQLLWTKAPGGKNNRGLQLKNGILYATTLDGGEGQFVNVQTLKVHTPEVPPEAPWPMAGGNPLASGHSQLQD